MRIRQEDEIAKEAVYGVGFQLILHGYPALLNSQYLCSLLTSGCLTTNHSRHFFDRHACGFAITVPDSLRGSAVYGQYAFLAGTLRNCDPSTTK